MQQLHNESSLLELLTKDVQTTSKEHIVFLAGHFPLIYERDNIEALDRWGDFSPYSLELACRVGHRAQQQGKQVHFVFFIDDHTYLHIFGLTRTQKIKKRKQLYQKRSGTQAQLPQTYRDIMDAYQFDESNVTRHNHQKRGRESCLYFSELILRNAARNIANACAREYVEFLENQQYFNKATSYLISFVPDRCSSNVCHNVLDQRLVEGLTASHVFVMTDTFFPGELMTKERLWKEWGVKYRRD